MGKIDSAQSVPSAELLTAAGKLLTDADVGRLMQVPASTVRAWRARGKGPRFIRISERTPRYLKSDVDAFLASRVVGG